MAGSDAGITVKVYDNGDHTCLVWMPAGGKPIANCRGFSIRQLKNGKEQLLHGAIGFSDADKLDPVNPWKFPVQRFMWWDYFVQPGDVVQYSVIPVVGPSQDRLTLDKAHASALTNKMTITGQSTPHLSAYFNKGIIASQWVARALAAEPANSSIKTIVATPGDPLRNALSGLLRPQILSLLSQAQSKKCKIFAALYELNDPELIAALEAFGSDCNLILANGAFSADQPDENIAVRDSLKTKSKINVIDRLVSAGHFAHNKFVVICDSAGQPQRVLTGSTNWTSSGLCTQANNGLIIDDPAIAGAFLDAWKRLKAAGNGYTKDLVAGNSTAKTFDLDQSKVTPWFVKTSAAQDLDYARKLINAASEGILFLFFNPGSFQQDPARWTLLQNIVTRHRPGTPNFNPNLYMRGVVNQEIAELTTLAAAQPAQAHADPADPGANQVVLFNSGAQPPQRMSQDVLVPHNIKDQFHGWEKEMLGASMVNIHSKVIVLDPFGANPVLMTGSHNLGLKASSANDDNLVIIEGNAPLAVAYAINILAIYGTYRWNSYVEAHRNDPKVWHGLVDNDQWQSSYLTGERLAELEFWLGEKAAPATLTAAVAPAVPMNRAVRSASSRPATG